MPFRFSSARGSSLFLNGWNAASSPAARLLRPLCGLAFQGGEHLVHGSKTWRDAAVANIIQAFGDLSVDSAALRGSVIAGARRFWQDRDHPPGHFELQPITGLYASAALHGFRHNDPGSIFDCDGHLGPASNGSIADAVGRRLLCFLTSQAFVQLDSNQPRLFLQPRFANSLRIRRSTRPRRRDQVQLHEVSGGTRNGKVIARFELATTPESADVTGAIEKALK